MRLGQKSGRRLQSCLRQALDLPSGKWQMGSRRHRIARRWPANLALPKARCQNGPVGARHIGCVGVCVCVGVVVVVRQVLVAVAVHWWRATTQTLDDAQVREAAMPTARTSNLRPSSALHKGDAASSIAAAHHARPA